MSAKSDQHEQAVADYINSMSNVKAERSTLGVAYSDIYVKFNNKEAWLEVKMNHTDNLANPRVFYDGKWQTTYKTPAALYTVEQLNASAQTQKFISDISKYTGIPVQSVKLPTTKKELLGLIGPESFGNTTIYDTATIKCKVKEEKSIYVSAEGILQPCCWVAGQMYNWHNTPKGSQVWKLINVVGKDSLNALNYSVAEIVTGLYFQKLISDSWTKPSCSEGKLKVCAKICGEETDVFSKQYT